MSSTRLQSLTLVLGGARSGKSEFAENLITAAGQSRTYIATGQARDGEMAERISNHVKRRGAGWTTVEAPRASATDITGTDPILFDCLTLWLSNMMEAGADWQRELPPLIEAMLSYPAPVVIVTNEIGMGLVPETSLGRAFRDAQGQINQMVAARANCVVFVAAGLPLLLKGELP